MTDPVDPVAVLRAAQGDVGVYCALSERERNAMWDMVHPLGPGVISRVGTRLGLSREERKAIHNAATYRADHGQRVRVRLGIWADYDWSPPSPVQSVSDITGLPTPSTASRRRRRQADGLVDRRP